MKSKLILLVIGLLLAGSGIAQVTRQGNFILGSTIGFSSVNSQIVQDKGSGETQADNPYSTQLSLAPSIGYFLIDNLPLGIRMDYTFNRVKDQNGLRAEDSNILFGPFARYYMSLKNNMYFFGEAGFGFGNSRDTKDLASGTQKINTNLFSFGVGPGVTVIATNAIGLEALVKYNYARSKFDTEILGVKQNTTSNTNQISISLGVQFYFAGLKPVNQ
ncbi:MAG: outer membrane beta-barrel protein [Saprospiraceae bacterium]